MSLPATVADILEGKKAARRTINLCLDGAIAEEWREADQRVQIAKHLVRGDASEENKKFLQEMEAKLEEIRPAYEEASRDVVFQSMGRVDYRKLYEAHSPASPQQKARAKKLNLPEPEYNTD